MAQRKQVTLIDDLDGTEADATVQFGIDGGLFEIELHEAHQRELFGKLSKFIAVATPLGQYRQRKVAQGTRSVGDV
ncbi:Lsr2 dimerization domain-containing protein [Glycomyces buryatensis]|uniref:Lsr2 family protein n=1 Tax=Glycomyces buryatensis TaxID=2570927 RepID=A0A4S8QHJ9_9ACTN|nr:histone-like nucleoid-structuring protein Lsr2 [Glycomyces buryatensis]THV40879.1 Lsr2 family protein [Glycomyces buryatensis]